eukprot:CAMPEP_0194038832 /NCGR_PEP_ID=MMETSP0009_2-20130614/11055_1 /TAXON_ID=210454 /ORGANISM="Grammatophora oceanica, Strain CCMP 410" /LENGTH=38 /DNA_ID= /DNA_START= /DNA_END= /DNA_ORIENTATION=
MACAALKLELCLTKDVTNALMHRSKHWQMHVLSAQPPV